MSKQPLQQKLFDHQHSSSHRNQNFEELYHQHINALHNYGIKFKANRELIEDCIQDLFADLWEKRNELDAIGSVRTYLLGALRRKILRKIYSDREHTYDADEFSSFFEMHLSKLSDSDPTFSDEYVQQLSGAFTKLTEKQKEVIYLRFYNKLDFKEIAEVMDVQTRTVYKLAYRAIGLLKEEITPFSPAFQMLLLWVLC